MTDWHIIEATSTREAAACMILDRLGALETFYPQRRVQVRHRRGPRYVWRAWVPGYIFARLGPVPIDQVHRERGAVHMRVLCPGGVPYIVTDDDLARMADVPRRIRETIAAVRAREAAERAARMPQVGQSARVLDGPLAGFCGPVGAIRGGVVIMDGPAGRIEAAANQVERVA